MKIWFLRIYLALSLRVFIAYYFNDFRAATCQFDVTDPALRCRLQLISMTVLLGSTILWPLVAILEPRRFLNAFLLGHLQSLNALSFRQGIWAAKMLNKLG